MNLKSYVLEIIQTFNFLLFNTLLSIRECSYTISSDIDVLVVFDEGDAQYIYKTLRRNINLPQVESHILSKKDYEDMEKSRWIKTIEEEGTKIL